MGSNASDSGESLHCFLFGVNKSYVIATSDLCLFIHASNLLLSLPTPLPYIKMALPMLQLPTETTAEEKTNICLD